ncbi:MAG TPA: aminodeoxychorismate/anthranilate synthase component II [Leptospiraceae bacterium]|nr:aminodeoxychorismate/anthranilate synthase component II [Leptospiraceae bacterium]HNF16733.1 aminodeoxychorismate/anthranilate synthase component II [Leptospiraceae bacterium]HNH10327.1 aminodeoxychorismate/anthranilate synthase component II [Leptospiraceae bacterium]HNI95414.1 aminodeoxychorismate/anthranilate synthase component II [Leptospiraceae bacterium]HNM04573.1 aminodeoxychorismate/anthranilate synthase component II [Leptospiraceae bacterium]
MKIVIIDNYDSFTFNLYQYAGEILQNRMTSFSLDVVRNDELSLEEIAERKYDRIVISPGPGDPKDIEYFGVCSKVILELGRKTPVLGVCLGMQGIAHYFGGKVVRAKIPKHGKTDRISHDGKGVFAGLPQQIEIMRYHSLVVDDASLPAFFEKSARVESSENDGELMGIRHKEYPIEGIQFHPESFATEGGMKMIENFIFGGSR